MVEIPVNIDRKNLGPLKERKRAFKSAITARIIQVLYDLIGKHCEGLERARQMNGCHNRYQNCAPRALHRECVLPH
jgi:hypothetical protein